MSPQKTKAVLLVGHGGLPSDYPPELVSELKRLEGQRKKTSAAPTPRETELDHKVRHWPRTAQSDPYQAGLEEIASALADELKDCAVAVAYNEFCAPSMEESLARLIGAGACEVTVIPTMYTRGGIHSETEIPEILEQLRLKHPAVTLRYAWPFPLEKVAAFLGDQVKAASRRSGKPSI